MLNREIMPAHTDKYAENWHHAYKQAEAAGHTVVEYGWEQHVIIDESAGLIYRYPRHDAAAAKLADEVAVLDAIHQRDWTTRLPVLREHNDTYTVYDYIPGDVLTTKVVHSLSQDDFDRIGTQLGQFLADFHRLDHAVVAQKQTKQTTTLFEYYSGRITGNPHTMFAAPARAALDQLASMTDDTPHVVVHGDLHGPNVVIDPISRNLAGVIDLSEMETGDPHQEFRKIFMTFSDALPATLASYEQHGGAKLDLDKIVLWAYVNEWANVCHFAATPDNATYQRAYSHLHKWHQL